MCKLILRAFINYLLALVLGKINQIEGTRIQ